MQFLTLIYVDQTMIDALPEGEFDTMMHGCIVHADELRADGKLLESQQLEAPATAKSYRMRDGKASVVDGPFAETKEILGGFNLIEADSIDDAVRIASEFPWAKFGCIEVRLVRDSMRCVAGSVPEHGMAAAARSTCHARAVNDLDLISFIVPAHD